MKDQVLNINLEAESNEAIDGKEISNEETCENLDKIFSEEVLIECSENNEIKLTEDKKSKYQKSKRKVCFKDKVKTYFFDPSLSIIESFPSDEVLNKNHTVTNMINDKNNMITLDNINAHTFICPLFHTMGIFRFRRLIQ